MSATERKLRSLKARRRSLSASFLNISRFVDGFQEPRDTAEAPVRLEAVVEIWSEYGKVQSELETLDETPEALDKTIANTPPVSAEQQSSSSVPAAAPRINVAHSGITSTSTSCHSQALDRSRVILATAVVVVVDDVGNQHLARALLDSGSECCFATSRLYNLMKVRRSKVNVPIAGIGSSSTKVKFQFHAIVKSRTSDYTTTLPFLILPKVTIDLPTIDVNISQWPIPKNLQFADPDFYERHPIDLVLGAEIFFDLFSPPGHIFLGESLPSVVNSVFGWVVSGKTNSNEIISQTNPKICHVATLKRLENQIEKFWIIDESAFPTSPYSPEESKCEEFFCCTVSRNSEGRYIVRLPLKRDVINQLGDNSRSAVRRFQLMENRLQKEPSLGEQYREFMTEYIRLGHMELVTECEHTTKQAYYLPHHPVIRDCSTTTKVRVVFDASSRSSTGVSLNNALMVGPTIQQDLRAIVMRSRTYPFVLIADIEKMYRQILVHPDDTPLQRIFWRSSPDQPIQTYELKTVTYGTASAPFLATRVLKQLAIDEAEGFPKAARVIREDVYMDDIFSGAQTVAEAVELRDQLVAMCLKAGFPLQKWASNDEAIMNGIPAERRALQQSINLDQDQTLKTLGLHWVPGTDILKFSIDLKPPTDAKLTKRETLSCIAQLFDPLGLVGPILVTAKAFMQKLWTLKNENGSIWDWDQELPDYLKHEWANYHTQLPLLNGVRLERYVLLRKAVESELHIFSDASETAYGACAYIRSVDNQGKIKVALLTSKSRIAPLKQVSIPRLELCGALLAAELYDKIRVAINVEMNVKFWTDSTVVLSWLRTIPSTWTNFVANRVSKIQTATEGCSWQHITGAENPADVISRGCLPSDILHNSLWWQGPDWLNQDKGSWPTPNVDIVTSTDFELRKSSIVSSSANIEPSFIDDLLKQFENFHALLRFTAYALRLSKNFRLPQSERRFQWLTTDELRTAEHTIVRLIQQQHFPDEWRRLKKGEPVSSSSKLKWFYPILSQRDDVIRIGGRIDRSAQPYESKHQIILPGSHPFTVLLLRSYHHRLLHASPQLLINMVRLKYWILGVRSAARKVVHQCIACVRARPQLIEQLMAELPASRVSPTRPFSVIGIDYWGPIQIKPRHRRDAPGKAYVAVFVCFSTKSVHLELVVDLTTAKFLQAFRRFVSRRGLCAHVYTDNGRNFVGAANELRRFLRSNDYKSHLAKECSENGIQWHFNPPRGSHFGGLWEAAINSAQKHFVRVLGNHLLPFDEMETLLVQIEGCLNSRPITPLSDDPTDLEPLTPGHFLVQSALKAVPDDDFLSVPTNRLTQMQLTQKLAQDIWKRWHVEYLATLQTRTKWCKAPVKIEINRLVLIKDENLPPTQWATGRIHELHPGADGVTRVVTLQTAKGFIDRPVAKLCLLPIASMDGEMNEGENSSISNEVSRKSA
ncbi:uncharacterized protein LOC129753147 [Uranotaenia lowii]|uniref:uncharacterized protein LOC129753147 n=1 Tax=Uranotaenia lowii TaxID=190385 RepID=UPI002478A1CA|nr:uncharacterized protein LOC129753147 [Uranotaenia lowii]